MKSKIHMNNELLAIEFVKVTTKHRGFVALIATVIISMSVIAFSMVTLASAVTFSDMVLRRELRIQTKHNLVACLDYAELMIARDYFLIGTTSVKEFGCEFNVSNDFTGNTSITATATLMGIKEIGGR